MGLLEANINLSQLKNQVVMEIGPGDHIALAVPLFSMAQPNILLEIDF